MLLIDDGFFLKLEVVFVIDGMYMPHIKFLAILSAVMCTISNAI